MHTIEIVAAIGTMIGAIGTAVGVIIAAFKVHYAAESVRIATCSANNATVALQHNNRLTSVTLVADALRVFATDKDMQTAFYDIEYGIFYYGDGSGFHGTQKERRTDSLLRHFSAIVHARNNGLIRQEDMVLVHYYTSRILANGEVQNYLDFLLDDWAKSQQLTHPYHALRSELSSSA